MATLLLRNTQYNQDRINKWCQSLAVLGVAAIDECCISDSKVYSVQRLQRAP